MKNYYLREFSHFNGENQTTFNILEIDTDKKEITVAITHLGKISVRSFDLKTDSGCLFFEYGITHEKIAVDDFEQIYGGKLK